MLFHMPIRENPVSNSPVSQESWANRLKTTGIKQSPPSLTFFNLNCVIINKNPGQE